MDAGAPYVPPDDAPDHTVLLVFGSVRLDRFLMAHHRERGWELPGGRVEAGESLEGSARREWEEETGLPVERLEPLLLHERPGGARGHVFLGAVGGSGGSEERMARQRLGRDPAEKIVAVRFVDRLQEVAPLAFPDDPYGAIAAAVWDRSEGDVWQRVPGEDRSRFLERLSDHPEAHPHEARIRRHPAAP